MAEQRYEAVIIGSGFGGAITGCRLAAKWPQGRVLILERGKRYSLGSFPRAPHDIARNFWSVADETVERPRHVRKILEKKTDAEQFHGMFDVRNYKHMDVLIAAGLGGGSLIYANVFLLPPEHVFDERWPKSCKKSELDPYYAVAKKVLGARPVPPATTDPRRRIARTQLFQEVAHRIGHDSQLLDLNVFFGNDFNNPLPIGEQQRNRYGALQTSCVYCAECIIGCNYHAKNTLDLNYLYVAEKHHRAEIRAEHLVDKIVPVDASRKDDATAGGSHGYRVYFRDLRLPRPESGSVLASRVVLSAGSLGSTELLLRCKEVHRTLPGVSDKLGTCFSGNGDFLSFILGTKDPANPNYGPVITQRTDWNLFQKFDPDRAFLVEDASYPTALAWFIEGAKPGFLRIRALVQFVRHLIDRVLSGKSLGTFGYALSDILSDDVSYHTCVLLCMGLDKANGVMKLDKNQRITVDWPYKDSLALYHAILKTGELFRKTVDGEIYFALPTWDWPIRNNITVHPLGGCVLADDSTRGVTSADRTSFGQVFGYQGLYVADGALLPSAVGANPCATISALSEMVAEGITGIPPDDKLGIPGLS